MRLRKRTTAGVFAGGEAERPVDESIARVGSGSPLLIRQLVEFIIFTAITLVALTLYYAGFSILVVAAVFLMGPLLKLVFSLLRE